MDLPDASPVLPQLLAPIFGLGARCFAFKLRISISDFRRVSLLRCPAHATRNCADSRHSG
nr:hypothetical protein [Sphingomonas turrisvirgatae]